MKKSVIIIGVVILIVIIGAIAYFIGKDTGTTENLPEELDLPEDMSYLDSITENILQSLNNEDYTGFSRDFSDRVKIILTEQTFVEVKKLISETSGNYISKSTPKSYEIEGYPVYDYPCEFEKENVFVTISFSQNLKKVEGVLFDSDNLREKTE